MPVSEGKDRLFKDPEGEPKVGRRRPCLCCRQEFSSEGSGNRLRAACRGRASDLSPYA